MARNSIELERTLDRRFAQGTIDADLLQTLVRDIGDRRAAIRLVHLEAHLAQHALLSDAQLNRYNELRGYATHAGHEE